METIITGDSKRNGLLARYRNGNVDTVIFNDGTKIRRTLDDEYLPEKPESIDYKITNRCTGTNCSFCHERSGPSGEHGDIMNAKFVETLIPGTELALGGGNVLEHPDFLPFLLKCRELGLVCNATFNQFHFHQEGNRRRIANLHASGLLHGIGISLTPSVEGARSLAFDDLLWLPKREARDVVVHAINGVHTPQMLQPLFDRGVKLLILGYKTFGRGVAYGSANHDPIKRAQDALYDALPDIVDRFDAVSFDNLAIKQLDVGRIIPPERWDGFYMGEEGEFTMYVDAVRREYAESSVSTERKPLLDDVAPMFADVRRRAGFPVWEGKNAKVEEKTVDASRRRG